MSDGELMWLYHKAMAFAFTSFYEGFGLPVLEALAEGCPVISSNTSSMPEVGGDAVEYCDPYDIDSIELAMENVIFNEERQRELREKSFIQASKFSYKNSAKELLRVYQSFL